MNKRSEIAVKIVFYCNTDSVKIVTCIAFI